MAANARVVSIVRNIIDNYGVKLTIDEADKLSAIAKLVSEFVAKCKIDSSSGQHSVYKLCKSMALNKKMDKAPSDDFQVNDLLDRVRAVIAEFLENYVNDYTTAVVEELKSHMGDKFDESLIHKQLVAAKAYRTLLENGNSYPFKKSSAKSDKETRASATFIKTCPDDLDQFTELLDQFEAIIGSGVPGFHHQVFYEDDTIVELLCAGGPVVQHAFSVAFPLSALKFNDTFTLPLLMSMITYVMKSISNKNFCSIHTSTLGDIRNNLENRSEYMEHLVALINFAEKNIENGAAPTVETSLVELSVDGEIKSLDNTPLREFIGDRNADIDSIVIPEEDDETKNYYRVQNVSSFPQFEMFFGALMVKNKTAPVEFPATETIAAKIMESIQTKGNMYDFSKNLVTYMINWILYYANTWARNCGKPGLQTYRLAFDQNINTVDSMMSRLVDSNNSFFGNDISLFIKEVENECHDFDAKVKADKEAKANKS